MLDTGKETDVAMARLEKWQVEAETPVATSEPEYVLPLPPLPA